MFKVFLTFDTSNLGYLLNVIERKGRKNKILENLLACFSTIPLAVKINVAMREQNCQKIGSERVNRRKIELSVVVV